jgi:exosortase family protein XrtF
MNRFLPKNPLYRFLVVAFSLYLLWYGVYELYLSPYTAADRYMSVTLIYLAKFMLVPFGYETELNYEYAEVTIKLAGSDLNGVWVGDNCNGFILFALFAIFVIAYPGPLQKKLWFIPAGIVGIHVINAARIAILTIIAEEAPETLTFNHNYTFTILVYGFVFWLWYLWAARMTAPLKRKHED